jgi:N-methylhydantoinase B
MGASKTSTQIAGPESALAGDPVVEAIVSNELTAIAEEMAMAILRAGRSAMVKAGDFATGTCDHRGRVTGQGLGTGLAFSTFDQFVPAVLAKVGDGWTPGDVVISNDHVEGGMTHLPDLGVVVPVFVDGRVAAFVTAYSHHTDIGGRFAGGVSGESRTVYEEGLRLPIMKLYDDGEPSEAAFAIIEANVRAPEQWIGDLMAKVVGCKAGAARLAEVIADVGVDVFHQICEHLVQRSEDAVREWIAALPDGEYVEEQVVTDELIRPAGRLELKLRLVVDEGTLVADFAGTSEQVESAINVPISSTKAALHAAVRTMANLDVPANSGYFRPLQVSVPEGSILNPRFPAAVGGRASIIFFVIEMAQRALAQAMPDRAAVPAVGGDGIHYSSGPDAGNEFSLFDVVFGGWGARADRDGIDGVVPPFMGSLGSIPAELIEQDCPVVVEGFGFVADTAGAGRYRGSVSVFKSWRFLEGGDLMTRITRPGEVAGLQGGKPGRAVSTVFVRADSAAEDISGRLIVHLSVRPGDRVLHATAGTGGFGDAWLRRPESVLADVVDEKLSIAAARVDYGVVIGEDGTSVDVEQTAELRGSRGSGAE